MGIISDNSYHDKVRSEQSEVRSMRMGDVGYRGADSDKAYWYSGNRQKAEQAGGRRR